MHAACSARGAQLVERASVTLTELREQVAGGVCGDHRTA